MTKTHQTIYAHLAKVEADIKAMQEKAAKDAGAKACKIWFREKARAVRQCASIGHVWGKWWSHGDTTRRECLICQKTDFAKRLFES